MIPGIRYIDHRGRERFYDENGKSIPANPVKNIKDCFEIVKTKHSVMILVPDELNTLLHHPNGETEAICFWKEFHFDSWHEEIQVKYAFEKYFHGKTKKIII